MTAARSRPIAETAIGATLRPARPSRRCRSHQRQHSGRATTSRRSFARQCRHGTPIFVPPKLLGLGPENLKGGDGLVTFPDAMLWNHRATIIALHRPSPGDLSRTRVSRGWRADRLWPEHPRCVSEGRGLCRPHSEGAKPADLPIEEPSRFDFVVNLRSARAQGLIPEGNFLIEADEVIE